MNFGLKMLNENIEMLRERLYKLLSYKEPTDSIVVECSQKLDKLLMEYENFKPYIN